MREALPLFVHFRTYGVRLRDRRGGKAAMIEAVTTNCGAKRNCSAG
jgi:hypothetical protein